MNNKDHDARYINAQNKIIATFKYLINEIGYKKISISKIIKLANVNRSTFYNHYLDKEDLMEKLQMNLIHSLTRQAPILTLENINDKKYTEARTRVIVQRIYDNRDDFKLFFSEKSDGLFTQRIIENSKHIIKENNFFRDSTIPSYYAYSLTSYVLVDLIRKWVENDFKETVDEFTNIITTIIYKIYENVLH